MGPVASDAIPALIAFYLRCKDENNERLQAFRQVASSGRDPGEIAVHFLGSMSEGIAHAGLDWMALRAIVRIREGAGPHLGVFRELLQTGDSMTRADAAMVLATLGTDEEARDTAIPTLVNLAVGRGHSVSQDLVCCRLSSVGERASAAILELLREGSDRRHLIAGARTVLDMARPPSGALAHLERCLEHPDLAVRVAAAAACRRHRPPQEGRDKTFSILVDALARPFSPEWTWAFYSLNTVDDGARADRLLEFLADSDPTVRGAGARLAGLLVSHSPRQREVIGLLRERFEADTDARVRGSAMESLIRLYGRAPRNLHGLTDFVARVSAALADPAPEVRAAALEGLFTLHPTSRAGAYPVEGVVACLSDPVADVRRAAARAVEYSDKLFDLRPLVPRLLPLLGDASLETLSYAAVLLSKGAAEPEPVVSRVVGALEAYLAAPAPDPKGCLWRLGIALKNFGPAAAPAVPTLSRLLDQPCEDREEGQGRELRSLVAHLLGVIGKDSRPALPAIRRRLEDPIESEQVRKSAEEAIRRISGE
ncbi:MAG: hypothetical protein L0216_13815 [Planctomycetales bacterium]|nr:hypothetical protein [Planctomycetales bacterium]